MAIIPVKEQPSLRDIFAANIAGMLVGQSSLKVDSDECWLRHLDNQSNRQIRTIAFLSYKLADALIEERVKKD
jgi:hypothetical protein